MYDRTYIDGNRRDDIINGCIKSTNILGLGKCENIQLYIVAMALGVSEGKMEKSSHRIGYILNTAIQNSYPQAISFMNAVHLCELMETGNTDSFDDLDEAYDMGEQYVNVGLDQIVKEAKSEDDEAMVFAMLRRLDKQYSELMQ